MIKKVIIGNATLYQGDCAEILPNLKSDVVLTDPPYDFPGFEGLEGLLDDPAPEDSVFKLLMERSCFYIIWNANRLNFNLPKSHLVWEKESGMVEIAYTNLEVPNGRGIYRWPFKIEHRLHPTQKPIELMKWCLELFSAPGPFVTIDPFMGCGTTAAACAEDDLEFIGIEKNEDYFDRACRRLRTKG
ncbi:hypothetical protein LCGC14_1801590 [marine sediment metagenome]|uniref:DNA methylase N-4/N-6 domain-containing protein n=1 Tax=marine sediment metagenome TaxID=412755 RepID=A0A0F9JP37_9ZZZZ